MTNPKLPQNGKYLYNIAMREPYHLPDEVVKLPAPPQAPNAPSPINLLTMILPPAIMILGSLATIFLAPGGSKLYALPMMMMSLGFPLANFFGHKSQVKKYKKAMVEREAQYKKTLLQYQGHIDELVNEQRRVLEREFPHLDATLEIGFSKGRNKRLWWRKSNEPDFLRLRCGLGESEPSFKIELPNIAGEQEKLAPLPVQLAQEYISVERMPFLVDLKHIGSLALCASNLVDCLRLARRLLVDLIVHHSPDDVDLYVISDQERAGETWEWLRWTPHVRATEGTYAGHNLLMDKDRINQFLDDLKRIFFERMESVRSHSGNEISFPLPAILVVMDDAGTIRQHPDMVRLASEGYRVGIFVIFLSNDRVPKTCRARLEMDKNKHLYYLETIEALGTGQKKYGAAELVRGRQAAALTRSLAALEVAGTERSNPLPSTVRISEILSEDPFSVESIINNWHQNARESTQLLFPVGQWVDRTGLATYDIDFRPEGMGGKASYHAMMIGTTGSGKSIFMQSMVLAAAHKYSPRQINFMFMDFKAGAAELKKVSDLPHSVGMITDLSPDLADRALQALENELARRKTVFDMAGKITDIWDFNRKFPDRAFPQLLVVIDEFAEGINILPDLVDRLKELGRQGRAFGMYFFLANQEVNSAVDALKANVSWYVLLKVNRPEEMSLIGRNYPVPMGRGHGYVKVKSDVTTIRGAYAGLPVNAGDQDENELGEYAIHEFCLDGQRKPLYRYDPNERTGNRSVHVTELDSLMALIKDASDQLKIPKASPIYLEPLDEFIPLSYVIAQTETHRQFNGSEWVAEKGERNVVPMGYLDNPQRCAQMPFSINFNENGGHLWLIGAPGSGKSAALLNLATAISMTHTPSEAQIYVLDFGTGALSCLGSLPHCGAVIKGHETERMDRLFKFLQETMTDRTERDWRSEGDADIYFVLNNVADFRLQFPDQADELGRFIRSGGSVGIHVILASNRGSELPRTLSGNMPRRIVLQMAEKQEYVDVVGALVPPLSLKTEGRGYLVSDGVCECQVALPDRSLDINREMSSPELARNSSKKASDLQGLAKTISQLGAKMGAAWKDERPRQIIAMQEVLNFEDYAQKMVLELPDRSPFSIPLGVRYDDLSTVWMDLSEELHFWTVIGPRQSGKSDFLVSLFKLSQLHAHHLFKPTYISFKHTPNVLKALKDWEGSPLMDEAEITRACQDFLDRVDQDNDAFNLLFIDDIGTPYANNNQAMIKVLDGLGEKLAQQAHRNFLVVIADLIGNLKGGSAYMSPLLKIFQQSQTGLFLSMDDNDTQYFNIRINLQQKKSLAMMPGRGFFVRKGKADFIQTVLSI